MERLLEDAGKISGQEYDMSNLNDVYEAIHVIQEELDITGTTSKEASETLSGSFNSMKSAFSDLMGNLAIGENVEQSMKNLIDTIGTFLIGNLIPMVVQIFKSLPSAINAAMSSIAGSIDLKKFNERFSKGVDDIVNTLPQQFEKFATKIADMSPVIAEEGAFIAMKLGEGLIKAAPTIMSAMGQLMNAMLRVLVGIPVLILAKGAMIAGKFVLGLLKGVNKAATAAGKWVSGIVNAIKGLPSMLANWASKAASSFGDKITGGIKKVVDKIKGFFPLNIGKIFSNFKLPHLSVSGGKAPFGIGGSGSLPKFSVNWYAKGGIVTEPTLAFAGMGEQGDEAIVPLDPFWKKLEGAGTTINNTFNIYDADDADEVASFITRKMELQMRA